MRNTDPVRIQKLSTIATRVAIIATVIFIATNSQAQTENILYNFTGSTDGGGPSGGIVRDAAGNLYGTTGAGGHNGNGVVFQLHPEDGGGWTESILHAFQSGIDGGTPSGGVVLDASGNVYGGALLGGRGNGLIFKLAPQPDGSWKKTNVHSFTGGQDGSAPQGSLTIDAAGNLYGATGSGGNLNACFAGVGCGVVFKLSPTLNGGWKYTLLHTFSGGKDGSHPLGGLVLDANGNVYGTTKTGGNIVDCGGSGCGIVFMLSPTATGGWKETALYSFRGGRDGKFPNGNLALDEAGNVYGTASQGNGLNGCGGNGCGVVFELSPSSTGWTPSILHIFQGGTDGGNPVGGLTLSEGNLYGTTQIGGDLGSACNGSGCGLVYKLSLGSGGWQQTILYSFSGGLDRGDPSSGVILDATGNFYGETSLGGTNGWGTIYQISP